MISHIFLMLLVILCVALVLFFVFYVLLPSLYARKSEIPNPLFSEAEFGGHILNKASSDGKKKAVVLCSGNCVSVPSAQNYSGLPDCNFFASYYDNAGECMFGCIGMGSCQKVCERHAISIESGIARISVVCDGCGKCVKACPRNMIRLVDCGEEASDLKKCIAYYIPHADQSKECKEFGKASVNVYVPKSFQFWAKCYKILHR